MTFSLYYSFTDPKRTSTVLSNFMIYIGSYIQDLSRLGVFYSLKDRQIDKPVDRNETLKIEIEIRTEN